MSREINRDYAPVGSAAPDATVACVDALDHDSTSTYALTLTATDAHRGTCCSPQ